MNNDFKDPYSRCGRDKCEHDLVKGVLVRELLTIDGPYDHSRSRPATHRPRRGPLPRAA